MPYIKPCRNFAALAFTWKDTTLAYYVFSTAFVATKIHPNARERHRRAIKWQRTRSSRRRKSTRTTKRPRDNNKYPQKRKKWKTWRRFWRGRKRRTDSSSVRVRRIGFIRSLSLSRSGFSFFLSFFLSLSEYSRALSLSLSIVFCARGILYVDWI